MVDTTAQDSVQQSEIVAGGQKKKRQDSQRNYILFYK